MRRTFTLQLHDAVDPDECIVGGGIIPHADTGVLQVCLCTACTRRRMGIAVSRKSGWWPKQSTGFSFNGQPISKDAYDALHVAFGGKP